MAQDSSDPTHGAGQRGPERGIAAACAHEGQRQRRPHKASAYVHLGYGAAAALVTSELDRKGREPGGRLRRLRGRVG